MNDKRWFYSHNCAVWLSQCVILCREPDKKSRKYKIEFHFVGGEKHFMYFNDKKTRDDNYKFIVRMMYQNYTPMKYEGFHWIIHTVCFLVMAICIIALIAP